MRLIFILLLQLLLYLYSSDVLARPAPLADYFRESWTTRDGLPHNTINSIIQSKDGYLWFATWEGAARYDGRNFTVFGRSELTGLPDSGVRVFSLDRNGDLLMGGSRGGMALVKDGQWQSLPAVEKLINDLTRDVNGRLWIATEGGGLLLQQADGQTRQFGAADGLTPTVIYRLLDDTQGKIWLATQQGLYWFDPSLANPEFHLAGPEQGMPLTSIFALTLGADGTLLVGTEQGAFKRLDQQFLLLDPGLQGVAVSVMMLDQQQQIWLGTINQGVLRLGQLGLEQLTVADGLPNNRVLALWQDREKSIWIGTNGGVLRLRDAPFSNLTTSKGLSDNYVRTVLEHSDGSVWIGSSGGLDRHLNGKISAVTNPQGGPLTSVLSLAEGPDGDVWVGSYSKGLMRLRADKVIAVFDRALGLTSNEVRAILPMKDGSVWVGTSGGLSHVVEGKVREFHVKDGLSGEFVTALTVQPNGKLWVGTGSGVSIQDGDTFRQLPLNNFDQADYVFGFYQPSESEDLWLATDRGLVRFDATKNQFQLVGRAAGLPFDKIFAIAAETDQYFWLSSNRGILRVKQQDVLQVATGAQSKLVGYELFGESDGMQSAQCNGGSMPAAVARQDGSLWFATSQGVAMVTPARLSEFVIRTPPVVVQKLSADGVQYPVAANQLPAGTRRVEMQFAGLSYVMPTRIQYRTKLVGFDKDWVDRGPQHVAEYTNLTPGNYQFLVSAAYPDGDWSAEPATVQLEILPFFWQRTSFMVIAASGLLLLMLALYHWRIHSLRRNEQKLRRQVLEKTSALRQQAEILTLAVEEKSILAEQLRLQAAAFEAQAREDGLTGLANRRAFDEQLASEFNRAQRLHHQLCLVIIDIDHFKRINDQWSHMAGDEVLKRIAQILKLHSRDIDMTSRWGGEEFALLLPQTSLQQGHEVCDRLRHAIESTDYQDIAAGLTVTASFGLAVNTGLAHYDKLISRADSLLYQAKAKGRNTVCS
ncbi:ligand-binding sensor domain-containing diguanylate cyclase [Rheinheimera sp. SA_1]|uniref:ligand-binding sensor domain-containing diguanylate cyclase n=1 Tax=Rheinheimera sp. SA_1 TaxID=1827365 RepID=UPI0009ED1EB4|nr:ligand-binding sensor domain-containing diguanylate cyclase [Rheinheimera sp. SA_1]